MQIQERKTPAMAKKDPALFLQSEEWEAFQHSLGRVTWRVDGNLVIRHDLPYGLNYLYTPRPATLDKLFFPEARKIGVVGKNIFLRIDPLEPLPKGFSGRPAKGLQSRRVAVISLKDAEEALLQKMHSKTRYNIHLAERAGIFIENSQFLIPNSQFKIFWNLLQETAKRDGFRTHERKYYEKMLAIHSENFSNELFFAHYGGKILASALVNFYSPSSSAVYLHGASSREHRDLMAPHLMHWRIIQEAKKRGMVFYDLGGIDERLWPGLTRFKLGFGAAVREYPEARDIAFRPLLYFAYRMAKGLK